MKKILSLTKIAVAFCVVLSGCSDESENGNIAKNVKVGDPIRFSAETNKDIKTRTSYGELEEASNSYPVYWENNDQVKIYCPQAQSVKEGTYTVTNVESGKIQSYSLTGDNAMNWGAEDEHHFYSFYPADRITSCNNGVITATVPREQHVTVDENNVGCNMEYALMAGHTTYKRTSVTDQTVIKLPFVPITTALDIQIKAPIDGTSLVISSITIANPSGQIDNRSALSGTFTYNVTNLQTDNEMWSQESVTNGSSIVRIVLDNPVTLTSGSDQTLTVSAFLLPDVPTNLRVLVNGMQNVTAGATITPSKAIPNVQSRKKTLVKMGRLPNVSVFSYETWMANLADNVYVSQISMPGTHDAGAYLSGSIGNNLSQTQTLNIESQLNAGIRVLDFRPSYNGTDFDVSHGVITLSEVTFDGIMNNAVMWLANHPTEFIIVCLKNESNDSYFTEWQQNIREKLVNINSDYTIAIFNPTMTLDEARGKLLFMCRDDYNGGWFGCKVSGWPDNQVSMDRTFFVTVNNNQESRGAITISDCYRGSLNATTPTESNKKKYISDNINKAKANNDMSHWYQTWLNVGSNLGTMWNPGRTDATYNSYTNNLIRNMSNSDSYENTGIIMMDWAGNSSKSGDVLVNAIVDNNFRAGGPARKN